MKLLSMYRITISILKLYARCNNKSDTILRYYMLKREKKYKPMLLKRLF